MRSDHAGGGSKAELFRFRNHPSHDLRSCCPPKLGGQFRSSFGIHIAFVPHVDTEVLMFYEFFPILILLAALLTAGLLLIIDGIRRQFGDRER